MAPEVVTEGGGSPGADRYALGIVAYQMLTGRVPFTGESAHSIMYRQVHDPPPPPTRFRPDLPAAAEEALLRQLAEVAGRPLPLVAGVRGRAGCAAGPARPGDAGDDDLPRSPGPASTGRHPGSGQTPLPRSGGSTRPVTAATLTPPGARALPSVPPAPLTQGGATRAYRRPPAVLVPTMASSRRRQAPVPRTAGSRSESSIGRRRRRWSVLAASVRA